MYIIEVKIERIKDKYEDGDIVFPAYYWKKATVKELIEYFK